RVAALEAVGAAVDDLSVQGLEGDALNEGIRQWLAARPEFEAAGVEEGSGAWARFTDGRMLIITTDRDPSEPDTAFEATVGAAGASIGAAPAATAPARSGLAASAAGPLPASRQVRLMN